MPNSKTIFLDLGANKGQSINYALKNVLNDVDNGEIYSFEPLPLFANRLKEYFKNEPRVEIYNKLVGTDNKKNKFYPSHSCTESGTMMAEKRTGKIDKDKFIGFQSIDFSKGIKENLRKEDYIILKIDIEGAEYDVLNKMIENKTINYIDVFYGDLHPWKIRINENKDLKEKERNIFNYFKNNNVKFIPGEVGQQFNLVSGYKKGDSPSFKNAKIINYDGNNPIYLNEDKIQ